MVATVRKRIIFGGESKAKGLKALLVAFWGYKLFKSWMRSTACCACFFLQRLSSSLSRVWAAGSLKSERVYLGPGDWSNFIFYYNFRLPRLMETRWLRWNDCWLPNFILQWCSCFCLCKLRLHLSVNFLHGNSCRFGKAWEEGGSRVELDRHWGLPSYRNYILSLHYGSVRRSSLAERESRLKGQVVEFFQIHITPEPHKKRTLASCISASIYRLDCDAAFRASRAFALRRFEAVRHSEDLHSPWE